MTVAIVGFDDYNELCEYMEEVIERLSLFYVVGTKGSLGERWAEQFGAPFHIMFAENYGSINEFVDAIAKEADFLVMNYTEAPGQHRLFMKMKMAGKSGIIIGSDNVK